MYGHQETQPLRNAAMPSKTSKVLNNSVHNLEGYILSEDYRGYDPYDALESPVFKLFSFRGGNRLRFLGQQIFRRLPVNVRPLMGIKKGYNPVTLALCAQSFAALSKVFPENSETYRERIRFCLTEIARLRSGGYSGSSWGYDFDWESRYASIGRFVPTVVATGFVTNALFCLYQDMHDKEIFGMLKGAATFVLTDLNRISDNGYFCFSYSPLDEQKVYNATMKAARLLAQVYSLTGDAALIEEARRTVSLVVSHQNADGSWSYSFGDGRGWADNFHTAYVLDCLDEYIKLSGDISFAANLEKGFDYYVNSFFEDKTLPKYYSDSLYPLDSTAIAQSILTLCRFGKLDHAERIALWAIENMQNPRGYFHYRKYRMHTIRIPFMRWSNAWMLTALSYLIWKRNDLV